MNTQYLLQLVTGAIGSVGFGILFHLKKKYLPLTAVGGFLSWLVFLIGKSVWSGIFVPSFVAGFIVDLYSEVLARICKETSTSFFVTSMIPLIPGSTLYYCMNAIVEGHLLKAFWHGCDTFLYALGIAAGMSLGWSLCYFSRTIRSHYSES